MREGSVALKVERPEVCRGGRRGLLLLRLLLHFLHLAFCPAAPDTRGWYLARRLLRGRGLTKRERSLERRSRRRDDRRRRRRRGAVESRSASVLPAGSRRRRRRPTAFTAVRRWASGRLVVPDSFGRADNNDPR